MKKSEILSIYIQQKKRLLQIEMFKRQLSEVLRR